MSYKPGDSFYQQFVTFNISGVSTNLDSLPTGIINRNCLDDFVNSYGHLYFSNVDLGRYNVSGLIPATYLTGDSVSIIASGYMGGSLTKAVISLGQLVSTNPNVNVVTISGVLVSAPNPSGAILSDIRYIQFTPASLYNGIAQGGSANTIILAPSEPSIDNYYQGQDICIVGGTGVGQIAIITSYSGSTRTAYIQTPYTGQNWLVNPISGSQYVFNGLAIVNLNFNQAVPISNIAETVGDALNAARVQAFGNWTLSAISSTGILFSMYSNNGTLVKSFQMPADFTPSINPTRRY